MARFAHGSQPTLQHYSTMITEQFHKNAIGDRVPVVQGALESPMDNHKVGNSFNIRGWAYSPLDTNISVSVYIDGKLIKQGNCEFPRYDIYQRYATEQAYLSGFITRVVIDNLKPGIHILEVTAGDIGNEAVIGKSHLRKEVKAYGFLKKLLKSKKPDIEQPLGGAGPGMGIQSGVAGNLLKQFIELGGLEPHHDVLDIGCGVGRLALPLTRFLSEDGTYTGTDNVKPSIDYALQNITPRYPRFNFYYTSIFNEVYNPEGEYLASEYRFQFDDASFDFVFLASVFTHMKPDDVRNYFSEISRLLRPGGCCFTTWFILNDISRRQIRQGKSKRTFKHQYDGYYSDFNAMHERAIAYDEEMVKQMYRDAKLTVREPIYHGSWSGLKGVSGQDVVIAIK